MSEQINPNVILSLTPDFAMCDYTNEDDDTTEVTASWRNSGYPVEATATVKRYKGRWVFDAESDVSVYVDDCEGEDESVKGLHEAMMQNKEELHQLFECEYC